MLYSSNVRKKLDAATLTQSRNTNRTTSTETVSLIGTNTSDDDRKSNKSLLYQNSLKKLNRIAKPSKSETTTSSSGSHNNYGRHITAISSSSQPLSFRTRRSTLSNESSMVKSHYKNQQDIAEEEEEGEGEGEEEGSTNEYQKLTTKLKTTFIDVIENAPSSNKDDDLVDIIKSQFDAQTVRIRRLERALKEKEDQLIKGDNEDTISLLLKRYPQSMELYRKQIEEDQFNQQLETCIEQFEAQKQRMMEEHQRNFEVLKMKYRSRFDDIVERMISDPSRLDDEWARRVKKEADDRVEEIKKKFYKNQVSS